MMITNEAVAKVPETSAGLTLYQPRNLAEAMEFSKFLASGDMVPKDYRGKPANVFLAMQFAATLGMDLLQTMQNISVINGRAAIWGDLMWAIVTGHPQCEDAEETATGDLEAGTYKARCLIKRSTRSNPVIVEYGVEEAKKAKLWTKPGPWQTDTKRMMQMRARGFACRDAFSDALKGLISKEEAHDIPVKDQYGRPAARPAGPVVEARPELPVPDIDERTGEVTGIDDLLRRIYAAKDGEMAPLKAEAMALPDGPEKERVRAYYAAKWEELRLAKQVRAPRPVEEPPPWEKEQYQPVYEDDGNAPEP